MTEHPTTPADPSQILLWQAEHPLRLRAGRPGPRPAARRGVRGLGDVRRARGDGDPDYEFLVRWDWETFDAKLAEPGDDTRDKLRLAFVQQRRGRLRTVAVVIRHEDEAAVRAWLQQRCDYLMTAWAPITPTQAKAAMLRPAEPPHDAPTAPGQ